MVSPLPKKGIKMAKKIKGISISALLKSKGMGIFAVIATSTTKRKNATKACQFAIGVEITTMMKRRTEIIFKCEGIECTRE